MSTVNPTGTPAQQQSAAQPLTGRIISAPQNPSGQASSSGQTLEGTVTGTNRSGNVLVDTPEGRVEIKPSPGSRPPAPGTQVTIEVRGDARGTPGQQIATVTIRRADAPAPPPQQTPAQQTLPSPPPQQNPPLEAGQVAKARVMQQQPAAQTPVNPPTNGTTGNGTPGRAAVAPSAPTLGTPTNLPAGSGTGSGAGSGASPSGNAPVNPTANPAGSPQAAAQMRAAVARQIPYPAMSVRTPTAALPQNPVASGLANQPATPSAASPSAANPGAAPGAGPAAPPQSALREPGLRGAMQALRNAILPGAPETRAGQPPVNSQAAPPQAGNTPSINTNLTPDTGGNRQAAATPNTSVPTAARPNTPIAQPDSPGAPRAAPPTTQPPTAQPAQGQQAGRVEQVQQITSAPRPEATATSPAPAQAGSRASPSAGTVAPQSSAAAQAPAISPRATASSQTGSTQTQTAGSQSNNAAPPVAAQNVTPAANLTSLPPSGNEFLARIVNVSGQPVPSEMQAAQAQTRAAQLTGTVIGNSAAGQPVVQTPLGIVSLATRGPIAVNTQITFEALEQTPQSRPVDRAAAPLTVLARQWPSLEEAIETLDNSNPAAASNLAQTAILRPGGQMTPMLLFFMAAIRGGEVRSFLDPRNAGELERIGENRLLGRLGEEFRTLTRASEPSDNGWRAFYVPVQDGNETRQMRIFFNKDDGAENNRDKTEDRTHFMVDLNLSAIGPFQLDGLARKESLDVVIRTETPLAGEMRKVIFDIFNDTLVGTGIEGSINFRVQDMQPLPEIDEMGRGDADTSGVVV